MPRTLTSSLRELLAGPKFGNGVGFRRMQRLLQPLMASDWGRRFTTIRVTGSNGKGSVTAILQSILRHLGVNCGRYTSPHLVRFNERIVIDDREGTDAELAAALSWVNDSVSGLLPGLPGDTFGSFELITAMCVKAFADADVAVGVVEAGIGGRYDPTRLLPGSLTALTSIDLEHTELLGKTKELVAYDKIDLCPDGGTVVGIRRDDELWCRIEAYCRVRRINLIDAGTMWNVSIVPSAGDEPTGGMTLRVQNPHTSVVATTPVVGTFQLDNVAVACSLAGVWAGEHLPGLTTQQFAAAVVAGLKNVRWPGRFECISTTPEVWIDVGHSPDACRRLVETVKTFQRDRPILLVTGVSANKAVADILQTLVPVAAGVVCTRAYHMGERVERIAEITRRLAPDKDVWEAATIEEAAALARRVAVESGMTVLVAGGLFLAVEFRTAWGGGDPQKLQFY